MTKPTVEEIVARIERNDSDVIFGDAGWHVNRGELEPLIASWRQRGEAMKAIEETLDEIGIGNLNASLVHLRALARVRVPAPGPEDVVRMPTGWITTIGAP